MFLGVTLLPAGNKYPHLSLKFVPLFTYTFSLYRKYMLAVKRAPTDTGVWILCFVYSFSLTRGGLAPSKLSMCLLHMCIPNTLFVLYKPRSHWTYYSAICFILSHVLRVPFQGSAYRATAIHFVALCLFIWPYILLLNFFFFFS